MILMIEKLNPKSITYEQFAIYLNILSNLIDINDTIKDEINENSNISY